MSTVTFIAGIVLAFVALPASHGQDCEPLDVGCCFSIATVYNPEEMKLTLYDWTNDFWVYMVGNNGPTDKRHQWKVRANEDDQFQLESVDYPGRCLCEKEHYGANYAGSCACEAAEPLQQWELEGEGDKVVLKRPDQDLYLYPCKDGSCIKVESKKYEWLIKKC
uniref:Hypothetical secreted simulium-specific protein n=1 Tax=Simulium guianense TaxID=445764 RepID=F5GTU3_SIMGU